jgi:hypothetical protein
MIAEITWQLRGMADKRQVKDAKTGLVQNQGMGGTNLLLLTR